MVMLIWTARILRAQESRAHRMRAVQKMMTLQQLT
jgi:hypothetical protein